MPERLPIAVGILSSVLITVPLIGLIQKSKYLTSLLNWLAGVLTFMLSAFIVSVAFDAIDAGKKTVDKEKARQERQQDY